MPDQTPLEHAAHRRAVREFARSRSIAEDAALAVYEREWRRLGERAKVKRFVGILAEKRAKQTIRIVR
jgi:hypothetical protein